MSLFGGFLYKYLRILKARDGRAADIKDFDPGLVKNILIVSSTAIGDTLLSTPAIRAVRKRYPGARIVAFFNSRNMELFSNNPNIDGVIPYYGGWKSFFSTIRSLRSNSFDLALILHGNEPQATPLCYLSGARFIIKTPNANRFNFLLSNREPVVTWEGLGHGILARLKTIELAGCCSDGPEMDIFIEDTFKNSAERFLVKEGAAPGDILIGFQPGASTLSRQWFPERFIELGKILIKKFPASRIVLTGSPEEKGLCSRIAEGIGGGAIVASGKISIKETAALIGRLNVFVTGDTGPMHIAYALKTPVVALYAVSDPARTGPLYDRELHRIIKKERTCEPCVSKKCAYQECMEQISVEEVDRAVEDILGVERA